MLFRRVPLERICGRALRVALSLSEALTPPVNDFADHADQNI